MLPLRMLALPDVPGLRVCVRRHPGHHHPTGSLRWTWDLPGRTLSWHHRLALAPDVAVWVALSTDGALRARNRNAIERERYSREAAEDHPDPEADW